MEFISQSERQTKKIAGQFAFGLRGGDVVGLQGPLGSGKTVFALSLINAFGLRPRGSPTFLIVQRYSLAKPVRSITTIEHVDLYRLAEGDRSHVFDIAETWGQPDTLVVMEWPEHLRTLFNKTKTYLVTFKHHDAQTRKITIHGQK